MRLLDQIDRMANLRNLVIMIVASIVIVTIMGVTTQLWVYSIYGDVTMPDTRFAYSFSEITEVFNTLGRDGLNTWTLAHMLDFLYPLTYMLAMAFGLNMLIRSLNLDDTRYKNLVLIPLLGGVADYTENILVLSQIAVYPNLSEPIILISSALSSLKWILLGIGFVIIFLLVFILVFRKIRDRS